MRILITTIILAITAFISSCDKRQSTGADHRLGLECFEKHRRSLPLGTQYEGVEKNIEGRLVIQVMNGVEMVTLDCMPYPDEAVQGKGK
jgi:hypothetical protein